MSLIHEMLKDLDKQKRAPSAIPRAIAYENHEKKRYRRLLIILLISTSIAVFFYSVYLLESLTAHRTLPQTAHVHKAKEITPIKVIPKIMGMSQVATATGAEVKFYLSKIVNYHVVQSDDKLILLFDRTELNAKIHDLKHHIAAINEINAVEMNNNTEVSIKLSPGNKVKKLALVREKGQLPALEITIISDSIEKPKLKAKAEAEVIAKPIIPEKSEHEYETALSLIKIGQREPGMRKLETILKYQPRFNTARAALAALYLEDHENEKSLQVLNEGLLEAPSAGQEEDYLTLIELKTRAYLQEGRLQEALALLKNNAPEIENHQKFYSLMAVVLTRLHLYREAIATYTELASLYPGEGQWWLALGDTLYQSGDVKNAVTAYAKAKTSVGLSSQSRAYIEDRLTMLGEESQNAA